MKNSFLSVRSDKDIENYNKPGKRKLKVDNAISKQSGVHHTCRMLKQVQLGIYAKSATTVATFKREMMSRNLPFDATTSFIEMRSKLFEDEMKKREGQDDFNVKYIKPNVPYDAWDGLPCTKTAS